MTPKNIQVINRILALDFQTYLPGSVLAKVEADRRWAVEAQARAAIRAVEIAKVARPLADALPGSECQTGSDACVITAGPISAAVSPDGSVRLALPCSSVAQAVEMLRLFREASC